MKFHKIIQSYVCISIPVLVTIPDILSREINVSVNIVFLKTRIDVLRNSNKG